MGQNEKNSAQWTCPDYFGLILQHFDPWKFSTKAVWLKQEAINLDLH